MDGLDLLFVVFGLLLLLAIWELTANYVWWRRWDVERRHERRMELQDYQDTAAETRYRQDLRLSFKIRVLSSGLAGFTRAIENAQKEFENFSKKLGDLHFQ